MTIEDLYKSIQNHTVTNNLLILKNYDNDFLSNQYIKEIAKQHNLTVKYCETLDDIKCTKTIFDTYVEGVLQVCKIEDFNTSQNVYIKCTDVIICCDKVNKKTAELYKDYIINIPKLEDWQIQEFLLSELSDMSEENIEFLSNLCANNIYRAQMEADRLKLFKSSEQDLMFKKFQEDKIYDDLTLNTIFDFITAVVTRDINKVSQLYIELKNLDSSPLGIVALLYNNFRNIINVQCARVASAETCGLKPNQFWAIKHQINHYTKEQLMHIFLTLTDLDRKLKSGEVDMDKLIDYLLIDIFSC